MKLMIVIIVMTYMMNRRLMNEQSLEQKRKISMQDGLEVKLRQKITES